jgi:hypothetical protein
MRRASSTVRFAAAASLPPESLQNTKCTTQQHSL